MVSGSGVSDPRSLKGPRSSLASLGRKAGPLSGIGVGAGFRGFLQTFDCACNSKLQTSCESYGGCDEIGCNLRDQPYAFIGASLGGKVRSVRYETCFLGWKVRSVQYGASSLCKIRANERYETCFLGWKVRFEQYGAKCFSGKVHAVLYGGLWLTRKVHAVAYDA